MPKQRGQAADISLYCQDKQEKLKRWACPEGAFASKGLVKSGNKNRYSKGEATDWFFQPLKQDVRDMDKRYLIYKCSADSKKKAITWLTAYDLTEAHEALLWLRKHHGEDRDLELCEGEFFEVLEESHIPPEEWQTAMAELKTKKHTSSP
jgi:hypothetical protein